MKGRIEMAHCHDKGMDCATIFEIANKIDIQILKGSLCLIDGIKVKQTL